MKLALVIIALLLALVLTPFPKDGKWEHQKRYEEMYNGK